MSDSEKSYYKLNKERIMKQKKEYREKNKERIALKKKEYYERTKEQNKEKLKEYQRIGYYKNKLKQKFEIMKAEILIGNDSEELLNQFSELLDELLKYNIISDEDYNLLNDCLVNLDLQN